MYMQIAAEAAYQSVSRRRKVGACIVSEEGLIAIGFNGTPPGADNCCEYEAKTNHIYLPNLETKPEVIHAERNALDKLARQDVPTKGAILFVTTAPCLECAELLASVGIREVYYREVQSNTKGIEFLKKANVPTFIY